MLRLLQVMLHDSTQKAVFVSAVGFSATGVTTIA